MSKLSEARDLIQVAQGHAARANQAANRPEPAQPSGNGADVSAAAAVPDELQQRVIGFLRGEDNPFDLFVAVESPDCDLTQWHVPEIHADVLAKVLLAVQKVGRPDYHQRPTLYPTRALLVRGPRGAGKTHLLHAIQYRVGGEHDLLVRPRHFEPHATFAEYLLKEFLRSLLARDEREPPSPLNWAAGPLTAMLLREAVAGLTPAEWLDCTRPPSVLGIFFGRRATRQLAAQSALVRELSAPLTGRSLNEMCAMHGLTAAAARAVVARHIDHCDAGSSSMVRMRRRMLNALAELALTGNRDPFAAFVEHEFVEVEQGLPPTRAELVDDLMRGLVELLAAAGVPVIVAFDNLERLLAPRGRLAVELAQSFFSGLAQVIDSVPGILVLLFVEGGLWAEVQRVAIDSFAHDRLMQGIRLRDYGNVAQVDLEPPTAEQLEHLVQRRMRPLLERAGAGDRLPELFPFERTDLERVARFESDVLRAALMRLRDRYDELVLPPQPTRVPAATREPQDVPPASVSRLQLERELLLPQWDVAVTRARRELAGTARGTLADKLHAGLGCWLRTFTAEETAGSKLIRVEPSLTFGDHPTYGVVTVAHWQTSGGAVVRVALGVVLGQGAAMPKDLSVKLSLLDQRPSPAEELIVLWPERDWDFSPEQLPPASQHVWTKQAAGKRDRLLGLPTAELSWLLAFADWSGEIEQTRQPDWPADAIEKFVRDRTAGFIERLRPAAV